MQPLYHELTPHPSHVRIEIIEQPQQRATRFRYECEGRCAGSIPGVRYSDRLKSFPTIRVVGFNGRAKVRVSCVTAGVPYRVHPHGLVGRNCSDGIYQNVIEDCRLNYSFNNLGIQCIKKQLIPDAIQKRQELGVDPFQEGYNHSHSLNHHELSAIRLCFEVFLEISSTYSRPLEPVVSDVIFDKKTLEELVICQLSSVSAPAAGGKTIILTCERVTRDDIQVRFFEKSAAGLVLWEAFADFQPSNVHKQVAITFKTPPYLNSDIKNDVQVLVELFRPSDKKTSEPRTFTIYPNRTFSESNSSSNGPLPEFNQSFALSSLASSTQLDLDLEATNGLSVPYQQLPTLELNDTAMDDEFLQSLMTQQQPPGFGNAIYPDQNGFQYSHMLETSSNLPISSSASSAADYSSYDEVSDYHEAA
ncbi:embryonic polarity protein dorsal-like [Uranotaenia lowii]|uniref:embryonic polarity protein dorsal-like n=1 Tax=Uranotaenia lowii TaxID=190385 RepID=UPI002478C929|nr:embryonic polarity protein dorsal-like [Uranotaenia lowii]